MPVNTEHVRAYIEQHFARIAGPDEIAEAFGVPLETLRRSFRREVGCSMRAYRQRSRSDKS